MQKLQPDNVTETAAKHRLETLRVLLNLNISLSEQDNGTITQLIKPIRRYMKVMYILSRIISGQRRKRQ